MNKRERITDTEIIVKMLLDRYRTPKRVIEELEIVLTRSSIDEKEKEKNRTIFRRELNKIKENQKTKE